MYTVDVEQGTQYWLKLRRSKIGASDMGAILGVSRYKTPHMVWLEKMGLKENPTNAHMERGRNLEPFARSYFNERHDAHFVPCVGVSEKRSWQMASFDGIDGDTILEIKCPSLVVMKKIWEGEAPEEYVVQVYHQMMVYEKAEKACLLFYHPDYESREIWFSRDEHYERYEARIEEAGSKFYFENMLKYIEPPEHEEDVKLREDEDWVNRCYEWKKAKNALAKAEIDEELARQRVLELSDEVMTTKGYGVSVSKVVKPGSVDYKSIPELKGMDLSKYRKEPISYWSVRMTKEDGE